MIQALRRLGPWLGGAVIGGLIVGSVASTPDSSGASSTEVGSGATDDPTTRVTAAPSTPAPEATRQTPSSPFGVYRGSQPDEVDAYEEWIGRPVDYVLEFTGKNEDWREIRNPAWLVDLWEGEGREVVYSISILPNEDTSLEAGARGDYDEHWQEFARVMVEQGAGDAILRLGWEFNGAFYTWAAGGREEVFVAYWRRIVDALRSVDGADFRFDWCPLLGNPNADVEAAYPGDEYVDIIGLDAYDTTTVTSSREQRWQDLVGRQWGLAWHRDFAAARGKPVSFPEWGITARPDGIGGGDNAYYIRQMHAWFQQVDPVYATYFEYDADDASHRLMTGAYPEASEAFRELFGS